MERFALQGGLAPLKGMIPPTVPTFGGRDGDVRFSRTLVTFAQTRLSSETGKGGGNTGHGRFVSADAEGRKLAIFGS